jgi:hypothetical protein
VEVEEVEGDHTTADHLLRAENAPTPSLSQDLVSALSMPPLTFCHSAKHSLCLGPTEPPPTTPESPPSVQLRAAVETRAQEPYRRAGEKHES